MKKKIFKEEAKGFDKARIRYLRKFNSLDERLPFNKIQVGGRLKHLYTKTIISKVLMNHNHCMTTEQPIANNRKADIYDASTDTIIEIEGGLNERKKEEKKRYGKWFNEIFIIDLKKVPEKYKEAYLYLKKILGLDGSL